MEWTNELILEFLHLYEQQTCIWNPSDPAHKNRHIVNQAWKDIEEEFSANFPVAELKRKKDSLMAIFRSIFNKVKTSKRNANDSEDVYKPTWFAYKTMANFLDGIYQPQCNKQTEAFEIDEIYPEGNLKQNEFDENLISTIEDHTNNTRNEIYAETITKPNVNSRSSSGGGGSGGVRKKRIRIRSIRNRLQPIQAIVQENCNTSASTQQDVCSLYAELLATKLRNINEYNREILMNKIDNLIFHAKMQQNAQQSQFPAFQHSFDDQMTCHSACYNFSNYTHPVVDHNDTIIPTVFNQHHQRQQQQRPQQQESPCINGGQSSSFAQPTSSTLEGNQEEQLKVENLSEIIE